MEVVAAQTSKDIRRRAQRQLRQAGHFGSGSLECVCMARSATTSDELYEIELALAKRLFETMERLDPSPDGCEWDTLRECDKEIWRLCIKDLLDESVRYNVAVGLANDSRINRCP